MKVYYVKTIRDKIDEAIAAAAENRKTIEYIELTPQEFIQFAKEVHVSTATMSHFKRVIQYRGVRIEQEPPF